MDLKYPELVHFTDKNMLFLLASSDFNKFRQNLPVELVETRYSFVTVRIQNTRAITNYNGNCMVLIFSSKFCNVMNFIALK